MPSGIELRLAFGICSCNSDMKQLQQQIYNLTKSKADFYAECIHVLISLLRCTHFSMHRRIDGVAAKWESIYPIQVMLSTLLYTIPPAKTIVLMKWHSLYLYFTLDGSLRTSAVVWTYVSSVLFLSPRRVVKLVVLNMMSIIGLTTTG